MTTSGYSGRPLATKLGIRPGMRVRVVDAPRPYDAVVVPLPAIEMVDAAAADVDLVHFFTTERAGLQERLAQLKSQIRPAGMIWVSWPRKKPRVASELTEDRIREAALAAGLVDVKVCAVDETWSGLKLVIPLAQRR